MNVIFNHLSVFFKGGDLDGENSIWLKGNSIWLKGKFWCTMKPQKQS